MRRLSRRVFLSTFAGWVAMGPTAVSGFEVALDHGAVLRKAYLDACGPVGLSDGLRRSCRAAPDAVSVATTWNSLAKSFVEAKAEGLGFRDWFTRQTIEDFRRERVVLVEGWMISETEFLLFSDAAAPIP